jgi:hypothetical protein
MPIPDKVVERLSSGLKRFQPILRSAQDKDKNESDTVAIVSDLLSDMFGFDKFEELTHELGIKGTYCDLGVRLGEKFRMVVEVKSSNTDLKEPHVKQAVDYAANKGIEWAALTNGHQWKVFRVLFAQPIGQELALDIDLLNASPRNSSDIENLFLLTRESMNKTRPDLDEHYDQLQVLNRFMIGAVLLSEPLLDAMRRELRRVSQKVRIENDDIMEVLMKEVIKREITDGNKFAEATKKVQKAQKAFEKGSRPQKKGEESTTLIDNTSGTQEPSAIPEKNIKGSTSRLPGEPRLDS